MQSVYFHLETNLDELLRQQKELEKDSTLTQDSIKRQDELYDQIALKCDMYSRIYDLLQKTSTTADLRRDKIAPVDPVSCAEHTAAAISAQAAYDSFHAFRCEFHWINEMADAANQHLANMTVAWEDMNASIGNSDC